MGKHKTAEQLARGMTDFGRQVWTSGAWVGWIWLPEARTWSRACAADGLAECGRQLKEAAERFGVRDSHTCRTRGNIPGHEPITR